METFKCRHCGTMLVQNSAGQIRDEKTYSHHTPGGDACVALIKKRLAKARTALVSIGKNTCGCEPLAAAYALGVLEEMAGD